MLAYKRIRLFKLEKKYFMQSQACIHVHVAREDEAWRTITHSHISFLLFFLIAFAR